MDATSAPNSEPQPTTEPMTESHARYLHRKAYIDSLPFGDRTRWFCMDSEMGSCGINHQYPESAVKHAGKTKVILKVSLPGVRDDIARRIDAANRNGQVPADERPEPMTPFTWPIPEPIPTPEPAPSEDEELLAHVEAQIQDGEKILVGDPIMAPVIQGIKDDDWTVDCDDHGTDSPNLGVFPTQARALTHRMKHIDAHRREDSEFPLHDVRMYPTPQVKKLDEPERTSQPLTPSSDDMYATRNRLNFQAVDAAGGSLGALDLMADEMGRVVTDALPKLKGQLRQIAFDADARRLAGPGDPSFDKAFSPYAIEEAGKAAKKLREALVMFRLETNNLQADMDEEDIVVVACDSLPARQI